MGVAAWTENAGIVTPSYRFPGVPLTYFQTGTTTPSATLNTYGTTTTITVPAGYTYFMPLHFGHSTLGVSGETLTVQLLGVFSDGSTNGASSNYTTVTGDVDAQNLLYGLACAPNGNAGQTVSGKLLTSVQTMCKSSINSSGASDIWRFWAILV